MSKFNVTVPTFSPSPHKKLNKQLQINNQDEMLC